MISRKIYLVYILQFSVKILKYVHINCYFDDYIDIISIYKYVYIISTVNRLNCITFIKMFSIEKIIINVKSLRVNGGGSFSFVT